MTSRNAQASILCLVTVVLASGLQQGCETLSSLQADNTAWEGHRVDDLIASWGQPDRIEQLGVDYATYTWTKNGTNCEQTFTVSEARIAGYSSSGCED